MTAAIWQDQQGVYHSSMPLPAVVRVQAQVAAEILANAKVKAAAGAYGYPYGQTSTALEDLLIALGFLP